MWPISSNTSCIFELLLSTFWNECRSPSCWRSAATSSCRARFAQRPLHQQAEVLRVGRLGEEVVGAHPHRLDRVLDAAVPGRDDDGDRDLFGLDRLDQLHPADLRHPQVGDDQAVRLLAQAAPGPAAPSSAVSTSSPRLIWRSSWSDTRVSSRSSTMRTRWVSAADGTEGADVESLTMRESSGRGRCAPIVSPGRVSSGIGLLASSFR